MTTFQKKEAFFDQMKNKEAELDGVKRDAKVLNFQA
jgi:hypothetical protein